MFTLPNPQKGPVPRSPYWGEVGFAQLIPLILLALGVIVGVYVVQTQTNLIPHAADNLTKATIKSRDQNPNGDGIKIHFAWSDGRDSYDFKDAQGNLLKGQSYATRDGKRSTPTGESGNQTKWSDGTIEYNVFTDGTYDINKSYSTCCGATTGNTTVTSTVNNTDTKNNTTLSNTKKSDDKTNTNTSKNTTAKPITTQQTAAQPVAVTNTITTTPAAPVIVPLTKADFTTFRNNFQQGIGPALNAKGLLQNPSNIKTTYDIANNGLNELVNNKVSTCPDDANVGKCLENFRAEFDIDKTAARLSALYGIFAGATGLCSKVDFGVLDTLITAKANDNAATDGRVNLCAKADGTKVWQVLDNSFAPHDIASTDTRFPPNPQNCSQLPSSDTANVKAALAKAESIFTNQGLTPSNCGGSTTTAPNTSTAATFITQFRNSHPTECGTSDTDVLRTSSTCAMKAGEEAYGKVNDYVGVGLQTLSPSTPISEKAFVALNILEEKGTTADQLLQQAFAALKNNSVNCTDAKNTIIAIHDKTIASDFDLTSTNTNGLTCP